MNDVMTQQMLTTMSGTLEKLDHRLLNIEKSIAHMLVLEERLVNQKDAMARMSKHIDKVDAEGDVLHKRINDLTDEVNEGKVLNAKLVAKVSLMGGGAGGGILIGWEFLSKMIGG